MGYRDNYQAWLRDFAADAQAVAELKAIEGDEKEIEDRFYRNLSFGTAGMRGVLAMGMNRMNVYTVRRATQGLSDFLSANEESRRRGVVIAYDSRRMSREFAEETALVLCANAICTRQRAWSSPPATIRPSITATRSTPRTARRSVPRWPPK